MGCEENNVVDSSSSANPVIPSTAADVNEAWITSLLLYLNGLSRADLNRVVSFDVDNFTSRLRSTNQDPEGVLSDISKVFIHLDLKSDPESGKRRKPLIHNLFVKIVPCHISSLVARHRLFEREVIFYRDYIPSLLSFAASRNDKFKLRHLQIPKYFYGSVSDDGACGVLVLEDLSRKGYATHDSTTMLLDLPRMEAAVRSLAEFHALSHAYEASNEASKPSIFDVKDLMWFQNDMVTFLEEVIEAAATFLESIPEEEETARRFKSNLNSPRSLFESSLVCPCPAPFRCLQHGDSWHNNFIFHRARNGVRVAVVDWQVSYYGSGPSDLCYLIYSSTTSHFRMAHGESLAKAYFENYVAALEDLQATETGVTYDEFLEEFKRNLKICLLFCASAGDLKLQDIDDQGFAQAVQAEGIRRTSIAGDAEVSALLQPLTHKCVTKRKARAIRRKNFLDICKEAIQAGVL